MAAVDDYLDSLQDEDIDAIAEVVQPKNVLTMRTGTPDKALKAQVDRVNALLKPLETPLTIYKNFEMSDQLKSASKATEKAFLTGGNIKRSSANSMTLSIKLPAGTKVLELPGGAYIAQPGITMSLKSDGTADVQLSAQDVEEFFNKKHGQDGKFAPSAGGGGGGGQSVARMREERLRLKEKRLERQRKQDKKVERRRKIGTAVNAALAVTAVVGLLLTTGLVTPQGLQRGKEKAGATIKKGTDEAKRRNNARKIRNRV